MIYAESKFDPDVVLVAPAPSASCSSCRRRRRASPTARAAARTARQDLLDPEINVRYGAWYLDHLRDKYADHPHADGLALAAYNAGQANVDEWVAATPPGEPVEIPFPETRAYVDRVLHLAELYRRGYDL